MVTSLTVIFTSKVALGAGASQCSSQCQAQNQIQGSTNPADAGSYRPSDPDTWHKNDARSEALSLLLI
ncbi:uncharacterized protein L3040_004223 [Drepanopeziza brunnea f. sp. 'multigermtubi']|uniref:uncharacterized protein n=1 Tax=Drepanopeziza brunnea f. sp. 'multigermtubi' TaxID=698441 RepID=UPI002399A926|nr:hypothetical protein L3040_004223 [Drepanopeziza brunnea f. sp. 'multigermtubi']